MAQSFLATLANAGKIRQPAIPRRRRIGHREIEFTPSYVTGLVNRLDRIPEKSRVAQPDYVHLSSLLDCCPRKYVLAQRYSVEVFNSVHGGDRVVWLIGRECERHVRTQFIDAIDGHGVLGKWRCTCGKVEVKGHMPRAVVLCAQCKCTKPIYGEWTMSDPEASIEGNPDLLFTHQGLLYVTETKSMEGKGFKELTCPKGDHVLQALGYRRLAKLNGFTVAPKVVIVYINKNYVFGSPYKEYHVDAEQPAYEAQLDRMWELARLIKLKRSSKTAALPPRIAKCSSTETTCAKNCPLVSYCFQCD